MAPKLAEQVRRLETLAQKKHKQAQEAEAAATVSRRREQVLADICRHAEEMMLLRARHRFQTDTDTAAPSQQQAQQQQEQQMPGSVHSTPQLTEPQGSGALQASDRHSFRPPQPHSHHPHHASQQPRLRTNPPRLAAVLEAVSHFCCSSCLLQGAGPEAVEAALGLSVQDWSQLWVALVYELSLLLDLIQRNEDLQEQQQQQQQGCAAASGTPGNLLGSSSGEAVGGSSGATGSREGTLGGGSGSGFAGGAGGAGAGNNPQASSPHRRTCRGCGQLLRGRRAASADVPVAAATPGGGNTAAAAAAAAAVGTPVTPVAAAGSGDRAPGAGHVDGHSGAAEEQEAAEEEEEGGAGGGQGDELAVEVLVEQFMGLAFLAGAVSPAQVTEAITLNHRTQRQQAVPESHWQAAVQRLQLSAEQAAHLGECGAEVLKLLRSQSAALHRLASLASGHSLLVAAAEGRQQQRQQQYQQHPGSRLEQLQQQEWRFLLHDLHAPSQAQAAALGGPPPTGTPTATPQPPGSSSQQRQGSASGCSSDTELPRSADAATAVVDAMDNRVSQLALWCFLLSYMLYDALTPLQRARLIVACYPWSLQPVPITLAAGQLYPLLLQQEEQQQQGQQPSAREGQQQAQQAQQREHQHVHRQAWWRERLADLPLTPEEAAHIALAGGQ